MEVYYLDGRRETIPDRPCRGMALLANLMEPGSGLPADMPPAEVYAAPDMSTERVRVLMAAAGAEAVTHS